MFETLVHVNKIEEIRRRFNFDHSFTVDRGRGGAWLFYGEVVLIIK